MLKNYLIVAFRNFKRQKLYSFINVIGLATGLACSLLIYLWVDDEMKKDQFHSDLDQIYHIVQNINDESGTITWAVTPGPLSEEIKSSIPEVEAVAPVSEAGKALLHAGENSFLVGGYFTSPDFFNIFSFTILEGNRKDPLPDPSSIVLTQSLAEKLFGTPHAIGRTLTLQKENELTVTAILEDNPKSSSLQFQFISHFDVHKKYRPQNWNNSDYPLYLKLRPGANRIETQLKINQQVAKTLQLSEADQKKGQFYMQPFKDRYLYGNFENGLPVSGKIKYVKIFSAVALFILIVACINFINLATARAALRHKEVGVRKVIGAKRKLLIIQFLVESILTVSLAMVLAIFLVELTLPLFNVLMMKQLSIEFFQPAFFLPVTCVIILTGFLAGIYPALVLSGINPVAVLKSRHQVAGRGMSLRHVLVVCQFTLSAILIVCAIAAQKQIAFIQNKDLGYSKENLLLIPSRGMKDTDLFKEKLLQIPGVKNVSAAGENLSNVQNQTSSFSWEGKADDTHPYVRAIIVGYDFPETTGIKIMEGRTFSAAHHDTAAFIVNQKMASLMNVPEPIGTNVELWGVKGKVIGISDDFHLRSLSESIDPVALMCYPKWAGNIYVRLEGQDITKSMGSIEKIFKEINPEFPFEYSFMDDSYNKLYHDEEVVAQLSVGFTFIAILISSLGLLGLASYSIERKKKEVSIRKVLGASVRSLLGRMTSEYVVLVGISILIGCPLAYLIVEKFLSGYAYHFALNLSVFLISALSLLLTTLLVISYQLIRAALTNPADNLRNE